MNQAAFDDAMATAGEGGCDGADETEGAEETHDAGCGGELTVAERIDELEKLIAELEESGDASPEELQELKEELMSLSEMEGLDEETTQRLDDLEQRLDTLMS